MANNRNLTNAIATWYAHPEILQAMLTAGHADVHFQGPDVNVTDSIETLFNNLHHRNRRDVLASPDTLKQQIRRMVNEGRPISHFTDKQTMITALSATLFSCAPQLNKWLEADNYSPDRAYQRLRITMNVEAFIGSGVAPDGSERATTAVTVVFSRIPSICDNRIYPFSITTMYPDITGNHDVGTIVHTGRNISKELADEINRSDIGPRMYWALKEAGHNPTLDRYSYPRACFVESQYGDIDYVLKYNAQSKYYGLLYIKQDGQMMSYKHSNCTQDEINAIRADEKYKFLDILNKANERWSNVVEPSSHLFNYDNYQELPKPNPNGIDIEEFTQANNEQDDR